MTTQPIVPAGTRVLVTGATGFVAMHCIAQLLEQGYYVRGTLRSLDREPKLRAIIAAHAGSDKWLELVQADLLRDAGWEAAVSDCAFVLHVASPYPLQPPQHEDDLIIPAREGTLRVLRAAAACGVRRVVVTSSAVAVMEGHADNSRTFTEADWTNVDGPIGAYAKSKTLAEQAAWEFVRQPDIQQRLELATINPVNVYGPLLDNEYRSSVELIRTLMSGKLPAVPRINFPIVDVRDVAAAHLAAMTTMEAAGKRFCCVGAICSMLEIAQILSQHFDGRGYRIPTHQAPDFVVRALALVSGTARSAAGYLGRPNAISNERIRTVLGWKPRSAEEAIISMAESMIQFGMV
jgi:dihydroflavonol-4-reductase